MSEDTKLKIGTKSLVMRGWFKEAKPPGLPDETGLYLVFGGVPAINGDAYIRHLIYIGQAQYVNKV